MAKFSPARRQGGGVGFSSARAEILPSAQNMKIAHEESQENQNGAKNTNRENRRIAFLAVWRFGDAQFPTFYDSNSLQDDGTEAKPFFGFISLNQKDIITKKEKNSSGSSCMFMASLAASYCLTLSALKSMFSYSI